MKKIGESGVDTGMLLIIDPAYLFDDEEWRSGVGGLVEAENIQYPEAVLKVLAARHGRDLERLAVVAQMDGDGPRPVLQDDTGIYIKD